MHFLLREENAKAGEHIVRVRCNYLTGERSVSTEIDLEPGRYEVLPKISATRNMDKSSVEDVVKRNVGQTPQKLRQIGLNHDIAHAKGGF